ncbi:PREDICTED: uncharacterized protein LOC106103815 isoform X1 [Papilio polytes]|uniref:uncharacterized protein LOC106103815 isoform X1 n=1 Tax=Papilio polytes TaxID=76194 RepID=UPI0006762DD2|nr:PREDICTED: uncharacterized protein LOC106103815 isoform X1 [Papilio polytes]XP_013139158.1 PREDICTED: uncharacterized protein LOC106103815 isoform X1 [Papilio polytes]XP_013139159.1 PREDICTED: uncharacterized protein LOC106103815 isoform X1 [Papilio polytes]
MGAVLPLALAAVLAAVSGARALPADTKPPATLTTPSTSHTAPPSPPALRAQPLLEEEEDQPHLDYYDEDRINISQKGMYLGSPCESSCSSKLVHVYCEPSTLSCQCDPKHPVALGPAKGCARPKKLGEQCFYRATCRAFDPHASCVQVNHNAYCQCEPGYHSTTHTRPVPRNFCTEDMVVLTADMPTLLGVASGIFVLAGLLCMVLHLYTRARYHPTHLADARLTPPCLYSLNDTGGTLSATRASSRASSRSGCTSGCTSGTLEGGRGRGAGASRAGSRRPSLNSVQSSSSSIRSYSAKRWEREREQKERRQMSMRLAQLHDKMAAGREPPRLAPTPSPRSPNNSTDGLLPAVCEIRELITNSDQQLQGVDGPCSSTSLY